MAYQSTITAYLQSLEQGDANQLLTHFGEGAMVHSPLYGPLRATEFYPTLFEDTRESRIHIYHIFTDLPAQKGAVHFRYEWMMANGQTAAFECVDVFEFDARGKIMDLKIIYDTVLTRPLQASITSEKGE